jgi:hypothetical protein
VTLAELAVLEQTLRPVRVVLDLARGFVAGLAIGAVLFIGLRALVESQADPSVAVADASNRTRVVLAGGPR